MKGKIVQSNVGTRYLFLEDLQMAITIEEPNNIKVLPNFQIRDDDKVICETNEVSFALVVIVDAYVAVKRRLDEYLMEIRRFLE